MKRFFEYFYLLSKLSTTLVLFLSLVFMTFLLYNSYNSVNHNEPITADKFNNLISLIENNQIQINKLSSELNNNILTIKEISNNFKNNEPTNYETDNKIENLSSEISKLNNNIIEIEDKINKYNNNFTYNEESKNNNLDLLNIKKIIFVKILNNTSITDELDILEKKINKKNLHHIDKILILKSNIYFDYDQLFIELKSVNDLYLKKNILDKNQNYLIKILSPIFDVKPAEKKLFENKEVGILKKAEEFFINKNFIQCEEQLVKLEFENEDLEKFKNKIKIYSDLQKTLEIIK